MYCKYLQPYTIDLKIKPFYKALFLILKLLESYHSLYTKTKKNTRLSEKPKNEYPP